MRYSTRSLLLYRFVSFNNVLKYAFLLLPNYCLGRGIMDLAGNQFLNDIKEKFGEFLSYLPS